jgi:hypothetical protein
MYPAATSDAMRVMAAAGDDMGGGWGAVRDGLGDLVGQLGLGELGAAFMAGYETPAAETTAIVDRCCQGPGRLAEVGSRCAAAYQGANDLSHATFEAITAPDPTP